MGVEPMIGLRSKLTTRGTGKWEGSSGDFAKFGLTVPELIHAVRILKEAGKEHCARLLHFHVGSQLTEIRVVKDAVNEGARVYAKLRKMGLPIEYFDVGGGLGVDYVGTALERLHVLRQLHDGRVRGGRRLQRAAHLRERGGPRAAHRLGVGPRRHRPPLLHHHERLRAHRDRLGGGDRRRLRCRSRTSPRSSARCARSSQTLTPRNRAEAYHDAVAKKEEALQMFKLGHPRAGGARGRREPLLEARPRPRRR